MKNTLLLLHTFLLLTVISCSGQQQPEQPAEIIIGDTVTDIGKNIGAVLHDSRGVYWLASNGEGVFRYDGKTMMRISDKDGLCSNFVTGIKEDRFGVIWFSTRDGVCSFDGKKITNRTAEIENAPAGKVRYMKGGLFFGHLNGVAFFDGNKFTGFTLHPINYEPERNSTYRPYGIYSWIADKDGNIWFGTQERGVCKYDGMTYTWFAENGLDKAAVRTMYQDKNGTVWAGNNGAGLFRFDGKTFINMTAEKGLENPEFLKSLQSKPGTLARPWTMNEDSAGNLWIGTIDNGLWKYDGTTLVNYTTENGLPGNSVWTIIKNNKGELLVVTDGEVVSRMEGDKFEKLMGNK